MKTVFKIIAKLISFIACFLEFAECVFSAMYSPSPFIESMHWLLIPIVIITIVAIWYPSSTLYEALRNQRNAERRARIAREQRRQLRQEQWKNEYIKFYHEMHGKERNRFE